MGRTYGEMSIESENTRGTSAQMGFGIGGFVKCPRTLFLERSTADPHPLHRIRRLGGYHSTFRTELDLGFSLSVYSLSFYFPIT